MEIQTLIKKSLDSFSVYNQDKGHKGHFKNSLRRHLKKQEKKCVQWRRCKIDLIFIK